MWLVRKKVPLLSPTSVGLNETYDFYLLSIT